MHMFLASLFLSLFSIFCHSYEVLGVGAPCVDFVAHVSDEVVSKLPGRKGDSTLVSWDQFAHILALEEPEGRFVLTGGSASNTIKGLAALKEKSAMCGRGGSDLMTSFYVDTIVQLGITPLIVYADKPVQQVISLVTPDNERTMYVYLGATEDFCPEDVKKEYFSGTRLLHLEGYALHNPGVVQQAIAYAKEAGAKVSIDMASTRIISTYKDEILSLLDKDADIVFANEDEIRLLTGMNPKEGSEALSRSGVIAVAMIGDKGCWVGKDGAAIYCPGYTVKVIDTTGAGDLFAAGFLHGFLQNKPLNVCGDWGNLTGSSVVQVMGAEIPQEKWGELHAYMQ